ncbi:hypothetical protein N9O57_00240 [bacterium]|nr:hypothetical protein [bacterium]
MPKNSIKVALFSALLLTLTISCGKKEEIETNGIQELNRTSLEDTTDMDISNLETSIPSEFYHEIDLKCESWQYKKNICVLDPELKAQIVSAVVSEQHSTSPCEIKKGFKVRKNKIIVLNGCRANFKLSVLKEVSKRNFGIKKMLRSQKVSVLTQDEFDYKMEIGDKVNESSDATTISQHADGIGVEGGQGDVAYQINHDNSLDQSEAVVFELEDNTFEIRVRLARLFKNEETGERAGYMILNSDREIIQKETFDETNSKYLKNSQHELVANIKTFGKYLVIFAAPLIDSKGSNSDFLIRNIRTKYLTN